MADQSSQAPAQEGAGIATFLSFLSHDVRGGLNGAVLMIEVLKRQLGGDPKLVGAVEDLEVVRRSILDAVMTMERFVNAEKLRSGRMTAKINPVDVNALLVEIKRQQTSALKDREMELEIEAPAGLTIASDPQLLMMVLQNLVSNAIKFGRRGKAMVTVQGRGQAPAGVACRFTVSDQGVGIAPEKIGHLLAPIAEGEAYGQKGTGLGLYIARRAAALLGAKLAVDSKVGAGSTFYLDLSQA